MKYRDWLVWRESVDTLPIKATINIGNARKTTNAIVAYFDQFMNRQQEGYRPTIAMMNVMKHQATNYDQVQDLISMDVADRRISCCEAIEQRAVMYQQLYKVLSTMLRLLPPEIMTQHGTVNRENLQIEIYEEHEKALKRLEFEKTKPNCGNCGSIRVYERPGRRI